MADEGFQEIQLTGKQVVFLFMATTVIAAGIFLSGVLVGRGVRAEKAEPGADAAMLSVPQDVGEPAPSAPATPDPDKAPPAQSATDELSYYQRLQGDNAPAEALKTEKESASARTPTPAAEQVPPSATTAPPAGDTAKPAAEPPRAAAAPPPTATKPEPAAPPQKTVPAAAKNVAAKPATPAASEPAGDGFVVQVASVRERSEADAILKHLQGKGYSAFVLAPGPGSPVSTFRVRVGKFKARSEAEKMAQRLEKEEQYKPWVTR